MLRLVARARVVLTLGLTDTVAGGHRLKLPCRLRCLARPGLSQPQLRPVGPVQQHYDKISVTAPRGETTNITTSPQYIVSSRDIALTMSPLHPPDTWSGEAG